MTGSRDVYRFGDVTVEPATFRLLRGGRAVRIEPKALAVLIHLIERRDRVVAKQELLDDVWKGVTVTENALTRAIAQIRKVIGDEPDHPRYIQTVPTRGYRFIAELGPVHVIPLETRAASTGNVDSTIAPAVHRPRYPRATVTVAVVAIVVMAVVGMVISLLVGVLSHFVRNQWSGVRQPPPVAIAARPIATGESLQAFPAFSPDGRSIAYTGTDTAGVPHIYRLGTDGGDPVQMTHGDGEAQPSWSPDGDSIAYAAPRKGGIWSIPITGGDAVQLSPFGSRPAWSPDGSEIAFQSGDRIAYGWTVPDADPPSTIWIVNVKSGKAAPLTQAGSPAGGHASPAWRADGVRLTFASCDLESCGVFTIARNGRGLTRVMDSLNRLASPVFTRDGRAVDFVLVRYNNSVLLSRPVNSDGVPEGDNTRLRVSERGVIQQVAMSPDGTRLAFALAEEGSDLFSVPARGGGAVQITRNPSMRVTFPAFSPDGGKIAYSAFAAGEDSGIWISDADGRKPRAVDVAAQLKQHVQWSRSGWEIFYAKWDNGPVVSKVSLLTGRASQFKRLRAGDFAPVVSPDEKSVAFNRTVGGATTVWVAGVEGGERQLTTAADLARFPVWSPSGTLLAVQVRRPHGSALGVISARGGPLRLLTDGDGECWPYGWSRDEKEIAFAGQRGGVWNIGTVPLAGGAARQVTQNDSLTNSLRSPAWSPAGDRIVYEVDTPRSALWISEPKATQ